MKVNKYIIAMILIGIGLTLFSACNSGSTVASTPITFWYEPSDGVIQTNDAARLQKEVPFTIIYPEYLPAGLKIIPPHLAKWTGEWTTNDVDVEIQYSDSPNSVIIDEVNSAVTFVSPEDEQYSSFEVNGINVSEAQFLRTVPNPSGQPLNKTEFVYSWQKNNISFEGNIIGYDQPEARKIIESMIK